MQANRAVVKALMLVTGVLLSGCGGTEAEPAPAESRSDVRAMGPTTCDPSLYCRVSSQYVRCADGITMYAFSTTDGWCIEPDVCARHGGPIVCPLRPE